MYHFWLFIHFVGLVLLAGGLGVGMLAGMMARKATDPKLIAMWSSINYRVDHRVVLPGALVLLVAGMALVHQQGYDSGAMWINAAYGLWLVFVVLVAGVLARHAKKIKRAAEAEVEQGASVSVDAAKLASSPIGPVVGNIVNLLVLVFLYLMIVKPS